VEPRLFETGILMNDVLGISHGVNSCPLSIANLELNLRIGGGPILAGPSGLIVCSFFLTMIWERLYALASSSAWHAGFSSNRFNSSRNHPYSISQVRPGIRKPEKALHTLG
jgi:hypothetical protein